ncbi:hypothetical protein EV361DRAFT_956589 [Lentinula raphanica]|nr:hypothetical protein EV361DRAFT_956589 [Lentinula raphanica]
MLWKRAFRRALDPPRPFKGIKKTKESTSPFLPHSHLIVCGWSDDDTFALLFFASQVHTFQHVTRLFTTLFPLITLAIHVAGTHPPPPDQHHQLPSPPENAYLGGGRPSSMASSVTLVDGPGATPEHGETHLPTRPEDVYASGRERVSGTRATERERVSTAGAGRVSQFDIEGQQSVPRRVTSQSCQNCINRTLHIAGQVTMCPLTMVCCLIPGVVKHPRTSALAFVGCCFITYVVVSEVADKYGAHIPVIRRASPSEPGSQHPKRDLAKSIYRRRLEQEDY